MNFDFKKIAETYDTRAVNEKLEDFRKVGWGSVESQNLRFEILSQIADLKGKSVLDVGCGLGDFNNFLQEKKSGISHFTGVDISHELVKLAGEKHSGPNVNFLTSNFMDFPDDRNFDYVFLSGALNLRGGDNYELAFQTMKKMFLICRKGIALNFLSTYVDYQQDKDFHFEPEKMFAFSRTLTKRVTLRHDYPLYEFTLYLYKV